MDWIISNQYKTMQIIHFSTDLAFCLRDLAGKEQNSQGRFLISEIVTNPVSVTYNKKPNI